MMYKIKMNLLSDALPNSGKNIIKDSDSESVFDQYGIPYIPAKRIKGLLRDTAEELTEAGVIDINNFENIFGSKKYNKESSFVIHNGYIKNKDKMINFINYMNIKNTFFSRDRITRLYSYNRMQTRIDNESGIASDKSLRTSRVLKKGLEFYFDIDIQDKYVDILSKILKATKNFGSNRTRGFGEISLELIKNNNIEKENSNSQKNIIFEDTELTELNIIIRTDSQIIVSNKPGYGDESFDYIPGNTILGFFAKEFIKNKDITKSDEYNLFYEIFLSNKVIFNNGYITSENKNEFFPVPLGILKEKNKNKYFDFFNEEKIERIREEKIKIKGGLNGYIAYDVINYYNKNVLKTIEYHHNRPEDKLLGSPTNDDGNLFQYISIERDQFFLIKIEGNYSFIKELSNLINIGNTLYLGKSRNSQYGKCSIIDININKIEQNKENWQNEENIVITLKSDMILKNKQGMTISDITLIIDELSEIYNLKYDDFEIEKTIQKERIVGGFNNKWKLYKIQEQAISSGSEIQIKNKSGKTLELSKLKNRYIGYYINEGYGKVEINLDRDNLERCESEKSEYFISSIDPSIREEIGKVMLMKLKENIVDSIYDKYHAKDSDIDKGFGTFINKLILIIKYSNDFNNLENSFNKLREPARKKLNNNINEKLFINIQENKVNENKFISDILKQNNRTTAELRDLLNKLNQSEHSFFQDKIFELYKFYAETYLTSLKLKLRG